MPTEKFEVRNRWTGNVQFVAEIETTPAMTTRVKLGLAVRWGYRRDADLSGADLRGADLSDADLSGADLRGADLSDAVLRGADLSDADLSDADLRGAVLSGAVLRDADLSDAVLSGAVLRGADLRGADLRGADLSDADLSDAVLRGADLRGADLRGAVLRGADLRGADLRGAPKIENIHQTVYAAVTAKPDKFDMSVWHGNEDYKHACETTHCRAGWVVALAGEEGRALEAKIGTPAAATLIYLASDPKLDRIPNFYTNNVTALEDMKRLAEAESVA